MAGQRPAEWFAQPLESGNSKDADRRVPGCTAEQVSVRLESDSAMGSGPTLRITQSSLTWPSSFTLRTDQPPAATTVFIKRQRRLRSHRSVVHATTVTTPAPSAATATATVPAGGQPPIPRTSASFRLLSPGLAVQLRTQDWAAGSRLRRDRRLHPPDFQRDAYRQAGRNTGERAVHRRDDGEHRTMRREPTTRDN